MSEEPREIHVGPVERVLRRANDWNPPEVIAGEAVLAYVAVTFSERQGGLFVRTRTLSLEKVMRAATWDDPARSPLNEREAHRLMVEGLRAVIAAVTDKLAGLEATP